MAVDVWIAAGDVLRDLGRDADAERLLERAGALATVLGYEVAERRAAARAHDTISRYRTGRDVEPFETTSSGRVKRGLRWTAAGMRNATAPPGSVRPAERTIVDGSPGVSLSSS